MTVSSHEYLTRRIGGFGWCGRFLFVFFFKKRKKQNEQKTKTPLLPASLCRSLSLWSITVIHWDCFLSAAWLQGHEKHSRSGGAESGKISQLKCNGGQYFRALLLFCVERCSCLCVTGSNFHTTQRCSTVGVFFPLSFTRYRIPCKNHS